ncbi:MAG: DUF4870 domain-containing protein [Verrucomicrobia bacterium]|nr:MAG: DUF4870 domain-containing protein [Verrucomicrobiota bacterium]
METATPPPAVPATSAAEDKTVAILSYITLIGFIAAIVIHSNKKTKLGAFHLRQVLGFFITGIVVGVGGVVLALIPILGILMLLAIWLGMFVFWILGLIAAINGQMKPMPVVGQLYQNWFGTTFD